jgi:hypothetical protein
MVLAGNAEIVDAALAFLDRAHSDRAVGRQA